MSCIVLFIELKINRDHFNGIYNSELVKVLTNSRLD